MPLDVKTLPAVPGATSCNAEVPLPNRTLFAVNVVEPVPPFATGRAVPEYETANVPLDVIGLPVTDKNEGTLIATLETVAPVEALDANSVTVPELFLAYSFMSAMFNPSSPSAKLPARGTAEDVVL